MTYVVTDECVQCKYTTCVEVCPVDCFHEGDLMLVINPEECIDCGICIDECSVNAIKEGSAELLLWIERAKTFSSKWPKITKSKDALPEADKYKNETNKFEKYVQQ